jgi:ribosomal protein S18 acetylase RimI-like enzyme
VTSVRTAESARRAGGVVIRPAQAAEFDVVGRLTIAAYRADGQLEEETGGYAEVLADAAGRAGHGDLLVAVETTGTIVGTVLFVLPGSPYAQLAGPNEAEFRMLAVAPSAQGRGVGEALVEACAALARQAGASAIIICVRDFAKGAQRLYARLGFRRVPARDWSPAPDVDLLAMRLDLTAS